MTTFASWTNHALGILLAFALVHWAAAADRASLSPPAGSTSVRWHVTATNAVVSQEVRFQSGDATLVGTLVVPTGGSLHPAVVVTHDASAPTRDYMLYRHLTEGLPGLSFAVFVYDRRGSGASSGDQTQSDYTMLADDAISAARAIAVIPRIDPSKIGYWGLSQGGWLSVLAAARDPKAAFVVAVSAPLTTPAAQMNFAVGNLLAAKGYSDGDIAEAVRLRTLIDEYFRARVNHKIAQEALDTARVKPWFEYTFLEKALSVNRAESRWGKVMDYNPVAPLETLRIPVLILYGDSDPWVPTKDSLDLLSRLSTQHNNFAVRLIPNADHRMMTPHVDDMAYDDASTRRDAPQAPAYFLELGAWLDHLRLSH